MATSLFRVMFAASLFGGTGVALGAFGAHMLKATLVAKGNDAKWTTAVQYQLLHSAVLLQVSNMIKSNPDKVKSLLMSAKLFTAGIIMFSGSIYVLCLAEKGTLTKICGPITPLGGLALIGGWLSLMRASLQGV
eukprot:TRINITY_DN1091_c4_g1_i1.p1 TRINITY_DN1091_c4_g1~~TRINITY_DN1091_c4_g1_i1.p1  ORF type:complete len:149 (+),score=11.14 TRINITY_DN1091_c4_g1_i1:48-449(+)